MKLHESEIVRGAKKIVDEEHKRKNSRNRKLNCRVKINGKRLNGELEEDMINFDWYKWFYVKQDHPSLPNLSNFDQVYSM